SAVPPWGVTTTMRGDMDDRRSVQGPSTDRNHRRRLAALAGHSGDAATALGLAADEDPAVRATALGALERAGALDDGMLGAALDDPSPAVRRRAAQLAAAHPDVPLLATLDDPAPEVAEMAAWACGERPAEAAVVAGLGRMATGHADP